MIKSNRGQLSIFMGITLILVMGMLAFIINVGLFVKAKINLQNAVDAAAFSGAATQARQLTNIAYVNWEMRNTYKEWMFKYYILGQMGLIKGNNNLSDTVLNNSQLVSFLLRPPDPAAGEAASIGYDKYNIPSICIHNNTSTDICPIYALPGIPRFPSIGVAGISEIHEALVNKLVAEKGANCSKRTQLNFLAAISWAYSSGLKAITGAPLIATNRAGAWPESLELAMRMRNLEMIVNRPPVADIGFQNVNNLTNTGGDIGFNERPIKAFMSAFRNLGGGKYKDSLSSGGGAGAVDELPATFKLTEISPQPFVADEMSTSGFLIPKTFTYPSTGFSGYNKHYLDLQAIPVNYATMFTTFVTGENKFESTVQAEASCRVSKSAIPVPGYMMGFIKNPKVLTYYAVKGEAEFTGLFFPRTPGSTAGSFKLTAYAAAKPFGGRIGPKLFGLSNGDSGIVAREDDNSKTKSYMSGIEFPPGAGGFMPGMPIPIKDFWVSPKVSLVGGVPGKNKAIRFGIPNMIYDFDNDSQLGVLNEGVGGGRIQIIEELFSAKFATTEKAGLYQPYQIQKLKLALGGDFTGQSMSVQDLMKALVTSRQVTKYDAANYLIPDFNRPPSGDPTTNVAPTVKIIGASEGGVGYTYKLFAPLIGSNLLYTTNNQVGDIVVDYMNTNSKAIDTYLGSLLEVGKKIYGTASVAGAATNLNAQAAQSIHANAGKSDIVDPGFLESADPNDALDPKCKQDMATKFNHFFRAEITQCGMVPLKSLMTDYIEKKNNQNGGNLFYTSTYYNPLPTNAIMTAYFPGPRQGAEPDINAKAINPIRLDVSGDYSTRRNFYSTKFIPLNKLFLSNSSYREDVFLESDTKSPMDAQNIIQANPLVDDGQTGLNNPFYNDF